jgi:hypothetical protein
MATPMTSTRFKSIVEPIMNEAFEGIYSQRGDEWKAVFKQFRGTPRNYHEEPVMYGFGSAPELPDGTPVTYDAGGVLFLARYVYRVYGLAFALTRVLVEDGDHIGIGRTFSEHLSQSMIETKETLCANILNRAFNSSYVGGDGVSLVNTAHPIKNSNFSNQLATAANLSQTSVEQMLIQIRKAVNNNGLKIRLVPEQLIVSPDNMFQAETILKTALRPGTADNDINPVRSMGLLRKGATTLTRLTSSTAWWIQTDAPKGLRLAMRRPMDKSMEGDFETDSMRYKCTERYIPGWTDPRCVWGTAGV